MNKKLLTLAVAAAVSIPMAATADAQIYGLVHSSIDYINATDISGVDDNMDINSTSRASRLGWKGSEDLGGGLKAIYKLEFGVDASDGGTFSGRNAYVGFAGDFGTFLYGRHDTPFKISTGKLDLFSDTAADYNRVVGFEDVRAPDAIAYISPAMSGFTFAGAVVTSNNLADEGVDAYSMAGMYDNGPIYAALAWESFTEDAIGATDSYDKYRLGLGYDTDMFTANAIFENQDDGTTDLTMWQLQGAYKFGSNRVMAAYGMTDQNDDPTSWALGMDHKFSKQTSVYALYADSEMGLNVIGAPGSLTGVGPDDSAGVFSFGAIHKF